MRLNFNVPQMNFASMGRARQSIQQNILTPKIDSNTAVCLPNGSFPPEGHVNPLEDPHRNITGKDPSDWQQIIPVEDNVAQQLKDSIKEDMTERFGMSGYGAQADKQANILLYEVKHMKISEIANNAYHKSPTKTLIRKASDTYKAAYQEASKTDRVEISPKAYAMYTGDEKLTATSGKDTLEITRGSKDGAFVIHFSDSAMVSRAVSRGYITVNGTKVELTDETKQQLTRIDRQAQAERERAFNEYIMQHELAVAQQQDETYKRMAKDMSQAIETAAKLSKGCKVSSTEEQKLMEANPQLYTMSKMTASMVQQQQEHDQKAIRMPDSDEKANQSVKGVDWSSFEWKSYDTRLTGSLTDTPQLQDVYVGEVDMKA